MKVLRNMTYNEIVNSVNDPKFKAFSKDREFISLIQSIQKIQQMPVDPTKPLSVERSIHKVCSFFIFAITNIQLVEYCLASS